MVEIISKRDGPRREDVQVKRLIEQNRSTIVRLADQISGGGYSASRKPRQTSRGIAWRSVAIAAIVLLDARRLLRPRLNQLLH